MLSYRNHSVIDRIAKEEGISKETAERHFEGVLQFLEVAASSSAKVTPSRPIDAAWHAFILHTRDYADYCQERFGRLIHHRPTGVHDRHKYQQARELAQERFGELDEAVWGESSRECSNTCDADLEGTLE